MAFSDAMRGGWTHLFAPVAAQPTTQPQPFPEVLDDAEVLLTYAAESGADISPELVRPILAARTAQDMGKVDPQVKTDFYKAYGELGRKLGGVTACTIRDCTSAKTKRTLRNNRLLACAITFVIASVSVTTFVANTISSGIANDTSVGNTYAATLRAELTPPDSNRTIDPIYAKDPCAQLTQPQKDTSRAFTPTLENIEALQNFATTIRELHGRALKLNTLVYRLGLVECDPLGACVSEGHKPWLGEDARARTQVQPAILNFDAEVLCKIQAYQTIRGFAANVQTDYTAMMGGIAAYALPIAYALLGAFAFRLRLFADTIRKRTFHPSFADSARLITSVIAGAIIGLFNPAQSMALSPLATAFLVGYGVEFFFKFLDTMISAFAPAK